MVSSSGVVTEAAVPARRTRKLRKWLTANKILLALLLLAALKCLLWSVAMPPWRAPDERKHFGYLEYLSREHSIPVYGEAFFYPEDAESASRTNFYGVLGYDSTSVDPQVREVNVAAIHPPFYYLSVLPAYMASSGETVETQLYAVRIFGAVFFLALIAVSYRFGIRLFPQAPYLQIGVPLLMIFHPQLGFISAGVINDAPLAFLFTYFLYQLVVFAQGDFSTRRAAFIGVLIGLGMLTKSSFLVAYPIGLMVIAVLFVWKKGQRIRLARAVGVALAVSVPIFSWFYIRNYIRLGVWQPNYTEERYHATGLWNLWFATNFRADLISSFVGNFSWLSVPLPDNVLYWFRRISELSVFGLVASIIIGSRKRSWQLIKPWLALLFTVVFVLFVFSAAYFELAFGGSQGRYLFPAIFPFWSLVLVGLVGWLPPSWRSRATALIVSVAAAFSVWALFYEFVGRVM